MSVRSISKEEHLAKRAELREQLRAAAERLNDNPTDPAGITMVLAVARDPALLDGDQLRERVMCAVASSIGPGCNVHELCRAPHSFLESLDEGRRLMVAAPVAYALKAFVPHWELRESIMYKRASKLPKAYDQWSGAYLPNGLAHADDAADQSAVTASSTAS